MNTKPSSILAPQVNFSEKPALEAATYINDLLATHINKPILLLTGGGSAMSVLDYINPEYIGNNITVTVTDDRFTDDIAENNFTVLQTTPFYDSLIDVDAFCIDTQLFGGETIEIQRDRFEKNIREWQKDFPNGIIIGLYGMGADGHIAGIIPGVYGQEDFDKKFNGKEYITDVDALGKNTHPYRITTTFSFMKLVDFPLMYVVGENKKHAFEKTLAPAGLLYETPARIIQEMKNPQIFTDISL